MKKRLGLLQSGALLAAMAVGAIAPSFAAEFGVSANLPWNGWMNVSDLPDSLGGQYYFGDYWGVPELPATFSGDIVTLAPNTTIDAVWHVPLSDSFWWKPDGTGNKAMDAVLFVEDHTVAGQTVTFSGVVLSNTLVSPYTAVAFVRDFDADNGYSFDETKVNLVAGKAFSVTRRIAAGPGHFVEIGFETNGPNAQLTGVELLGAVEVGPPDPSILLQHLLAKVTEVGPGMSLADKVMAAQASYSVRDIQGVCGVIKGFANEVRAQRGKKIASMLSDSLASEAKAIRAVIGCK